MLFCKMVKQCCMLETIGRTPVAMTPFCSPPPSITTNEKFLTLSIGKLKYSGLLLNSLGGTSSSHKVLT